MMVIRFGALSLLAVHLVLFAGPELAAQSPPSGQGAAAMLEKLRRLPTIASVLHTTAHPDDEHGGLLTSLSRGQGVRVSLLTLTRGESGDNAIGSELFDALGLIRTDELLQADRFYGVDHQYFTTVVDYGFSKRLDEALEKWGHDAVLRDVVRVFREDRPLVVISRFQGSERDGHGNHQAAGVITAEAFKAAGDAAMFPDQLRDGLRPWQPLKLYVGGVRESEDWTITVDTGRYDPVLGESYQNVARLGLAYQRSQNGGVIGLVPGPSISYYRRVACLVDAPAKESSFFDGIDLDDSGIYRALRKEPSSQRLPFCWRALPIRIDAAVHCLQRGGSVGVGSFARASPCRDTRRGIDGSGEDVRFIMRGRKRRSSKDTIEAGAGCPAHGRRAAVRSLCAWRSPRDDGSSRPGTGVRRSRLIYHSGFRARFPEYD